MLFSDMQEKNYSIYSFPLKSDYLHSIFFLSFSNQHLQVDNTFDYSVCSQQLLSTLASKPPWWHANITVLLQVHRFSMKPTEAKSGSFILWENGLQQNKKIQNISLFCHHLNELHHI